MTQVTLPEEGLGIIFGTHDEHLKRIERTFGVEVAARGSELRIEGDPERVETVERLLDGLSELARQGYRLRPSDVTTAIRVMSEDPATSLTSFFQPEGMLGQVRRLIQPRTLKQMLYMQAMVDNDLVISIGPAGTGKTYLAVAVAAAYLLEKKVRRIMRENDLNPKRKRRYVATTDSDHDSPIYPNVAGNFEVHGPDQLWVGDITYVAIATGFVVVYTHKLGNEASKLCLLDA